MNTEDRELLELAAKAAGIEHVTPTMIESNKWNPLEDDGDAFRLMVALNLDVLPQPDGKVEASNQWLTEDEFCWAWEDNTQDPLHATRRAIVRAAAEIGRGMA